MIQNCEGISSTSLVFSKEGFAENDIVPPMRGSMTIKHIPMFPLLGNQHFLQGYVGTSF